MILYFSGTGNSEYVAKKITSQTDDELFSINNSIKSGKKEMLDSKEPFVIVTPTYAWRIPRVVEEWIRKTTFSGNNNVYFIMTCGSENGNADKYLRRLCEEKQFNYMGCAEIVMPENYITLFSAPEKAEAVSIIEKAEPMIQKTIACIADMRKLDAQKVSLADKMMSGFVNQIFYPMFVSAKKFYTTEECIGCGICVKKCPLNNIQLKNGNPEWGTDCTQCMACICDCPKAAIEYGNRSKGKVRYHCPR